MTGFARMAGVLGLITAVGPFAIDMYLPALPTIGASLGANPASVQLSMTAFFATLGVCQLCYGPLSDIVGRKLPIYMGLGIFILGSIGCALAPTISVLVAFRVVQAFGACACMVVPRAIVRDLHTGPDAARLMSLLMLVVGISPILAPLSGSAVMGLDGWRGVFWVLTAAATIALLIAILLLGETHPAARRAGNTWLGAVASYRTLASDRRFVGLAFAGGCGISSFFVFIAHASFVYIDHYGMTQTQFSLLFAVNAISFFGCSQLTGTLAHRFGLPSVVRVAVTGFAATMSAVAILMALGWQSWPLMAAFLFVGYGFLGLVLPSTAVLALDSHGRSAGTASALLGAIQMVTGAVFAGLSGLFTDPGPTPMIISIGLCSLATFAMSYLALSQGAQFLPVQAE